MEIQSVTTAKKHWEIFKKKTRRRKTRASTDVFIQKLKIATTITTIIY